MEPDLTITNEQINSLPLLIGIMEDMGIRDMIDAKITPHGHWEGASVGTVITIWLSHMLSERDHCLSHVRDWANDQSHTINTLLDITLRDTDCTDDRLANILTMLGTMEVQEELDTAMMQHWIRVYRLPTTTVRLDSTSVSVYHDPTEMETMLLRGHSKDHRPDLRQFKLMLATLDPMGMPICCQPVKGNSADDPLYLPAYHQAVTVLGTTDVMAVGDAKMAPLSTRGAIVFHQSRYLCAYRPSRPTSDWTDWVAEALAHKDEWMWDREPTDQDGRATAVYETTREQTWVDPATGQSVTWTERVLLSRRTSTHQAQLRARERALERLTMDLERLRVYPKRGCKYYRTQADLESVVKDKVKKSGLEDLVTVTVKEEFSTAGTARWVVESVTVNHLQWHTTGQQLGWQVHLSNATTDEYDTITLLGAYRQQVIEERGFSRLKTRNLQIRPLYLRDETRIKGLIWLLCLALRILTLTEQRVRWALEERKETLVGLNPASRTQTTARPTAERLFRAFKNITLTMVEQDRYCQVYVTPLSQTQRHILSLLNLSPALYEGLDGSVRYSDMHLRE